MTHLEPQVAALISLGIWEMVLLFGVLMLLFGAKKLPDLARGLGSGIRNFKGELKAPESEEGPGSDVDSEANRP